MSDPDLAQRALRAARSNVIAFPVIAISTFLASVVVARVLSVEDFAVYALALALRGTVQFFADFGTGTASARAFAQLESAHRGISALRLYRRLLVARVIAASVLAVGVLLGADRVLRYLEIGADQRGLLRWFVVMAAAEIVAGFGFYVLTGTLGQRWLNRVLVFFSVAQPMLVVIAVFVGLGLAGVLAALAVASAGKAIAFHAGALRALRRFDAHGEDGTSVAWSLTRTAAAAGVGKLAAWLHSRPALSLFMLPAAGSAEFAAFALGYDLAHQSMSVVAAPTGNVAPAVVAKTAADRQRLRRIVASLIILVLTLSSGFGVLVAVAMPVLDGPIYGHAYDDMGRYFAVLIPAVTADIALATPATAILLSDDRLLKRFAVVRAFEGAFVVLYLIVGLDHLLAVAGIMTAVRCSTAVALIALAEDAIGPMVPAAWRRRFCIAVALPAALGAAGILLPLPAVPRAAVCVMLAAGSFVLLVRGLRLLGEAELRLLQRAFPKGRRISRWIVADSSRRSASALRPG